MKQILPNIYFLWNYWYRKFLQLQLLNANKKQNFKCNTKEMKVYFIFNILVIFIPYLYMWCKYINRHLAIRNLMWLWNKICCLTSVKKKKSFIQKEFYEEKFGRKIETPKMKTKWLFIFSQAFMSCKS